MKNNDKALEAAQRWSKHVWQRLLLLNTKPIVAFAPSGATPAIAEWARNFFLPPFLVFNEAATATEPKVISTINTFPSLDRVVLASDNKQLRIRILNQPSSEFRPQLILPLSDRLHSESNSTILTTTWRCNQDTMGWSINNVYQDQDLELHCQASAWRETSLLIKSWAFTKPQYRRDSDQRAWAVRVPGLSQLGPSHNPHTRTAIINFAIQLVREAKVSPKNIRVLSAYPESRDRLIQGLSERAKGADASFLKDILVYTVHSVHGREEEVVLVDLCFVPY